MRFKSLEENSSYLIYPDGRIYSIKSAKFLKLITSNGNKCIKISTNRNKNSTLYIARLLYYYFIDEFDKSDSNYIIKFKDSNQVNLSLDNLILTKRSDICIHRNTELNIRPGNDELIKKVYKDFNEFNASLVSLSKKYNVSPTTIRRWINKFNKLNQS